MNSLRDRARTGNNNSIVIHMLNFWGGREGGIADLVCVRIFFSNLWRKNFFQHYAPGENFFSVKEFFSPVLIFFQDFFPRNQSAGYIFSEITLTPSPPSLKKANGRPLTDKFHMFLLWCLIRVKSTLLSEEIYLQSPREDFAQWKSKLKMNRIFNPRFG